MLSRQGSHSEHRQKRSRTRAPTIDDLQTASDTLSSDSELGSDFSLDLIEDMDEEEEVDIGDMAQPEALNITKVAVEGPRIQVPVVPSGRKAMPQRPIGLVYTGNSARTRRYK